MLKNLWDESQAAKHTTPLAQRVYSSRLLGSEPSLVMHGGGNTSVKTKLPNLLGEDEDVLLIKGSGWDLATIEAPGFPAVRLNHLLKLRQLSALGDIQMMNELRTHLMDSHSPDPSVEALLHAFLPHRFVDHTHADAILTLTNQPDGEKLIRNLFGDRVSIVPYVMPGFLLAKRCAEVFERNPKVEGMVLLHHGLFTFGDSAKESYDRTIALVNQAEEFILSETGEQPAALAVRDDEFRAFWMQAIRRELLRRGLPSVLTLNASREALYFVNHARCADISQRGPLTPDHVIRTKRLPLAVPKNLVQEKSDSGLGRLFDRYATEYEAYFAKHAKRKASDGALQILDRLPRVFLLPGVGIVTAGLSLKDARIAEDIYGHTASVILKSEQMSGYEALGEEDIFDVEYWVLEQAKLRLGPKRLPLSGKIAVVTGGASGIGLAIVREFLAQGALVYAVDIQSSLFSELEKKLAGNPKSGNAVRFLKADVSSRSEVASAMTQIIETSGGIDIAVMNAGILPETKLVEELSVESWDKSLSINLTGSFHFAAEVLRWMKTQGNGGDILVVGSKNVPAPGPQAAAYSVAKAGQTQLARVCALEGGPHGIRVNVLHPHLIFDTALWSGNVLEKRAEAYGMTPEQYKKNNLLRTELTSLDVAKAAFGLVSGLFSKTTGAQIPLDGGSDRTL